MAFPVKEWADWPSDTFSEASIYTGDYTGDTTIGPNDRYWRHVREGIEISASIDGEDLPVARGNTFTKTRMVHGANSYVGRPKAHQVKWIGSAEPFYALDGDEWLDV